MVATHQCDMDILGYLENNARLTDTKFGALLHETYRLMEYREPKIVGLNVKDFAFAREWGDCAYREDTM